MRLRINAKLLFIAVLLFLSALSLFADEYTYGATVTIDSTTTHYASVSAALSSFSTSSTTMDNCLVKLYQDEGSIYSNSYFAVKQSCTIDLNGHKLSSANDVVQIPTGKSVTIKNGSISVHSNTNKSCFAANGTIYISDITFSGFNCFYGCGGNTTFGHGVVCNCYSLYSSNGDSTLNIKDGVYHFTTLDCVVGQTNRDNLKISGGCFKYTSSVLQNYLQSGYKAIICTHGRTNYSDVVAFNGTGSIKAYVTTVDSYGDNVSVAYSSLDSAIAAAKSGDTVTLISADSSNITLSSGVTFETVGNIYTGTISISADLATIGGYEVVHTTDGSNHYYNVEHQHTWIYTKEYDTIKASCEWDYCQYHTQVVSVQLLVPATILQATVIPTSVEQSVVWSSDDLSIAKVDSETGLIQGVSAGSSTITATALDGGGISKSVQVTVK